VYVIDNASTDGSVDYVSRHHKGVRIIRNSKNSGYTGGYNYGMEHLREDIVVLLNSDVEVSESWLEPIVQRFEEDENLAALQPKILDYKRRNYFEYAGGAGGFIDWLGYPFCRGRIFQELEEDKGQYDADMEIFWASGACLAVRRKMFMAAGELDPLFFAHFEEIDLCWRMRRNGWKVAYCGSSVVYHVGGGTLNNLNPRKTYYNFRNNLFVLFKNMPFGWLWPVIFSRLFMDGLAGILFILQGKPSHTFAVIRAHFSFYRHYRQLHHRRKDLKHLPRKWPLKDVYTGSVAIGFFLHGKKHFSDLLPKKLKH
jgi:GT2 family glycosyltransferase